jgi:undecaprenyl diphosphate synthase
MAKRMATDRLEASFGAVRLSGEALADAAGAAKSEDLAADLPRHVAIIMDGNGRWAERRGLPRVEGHRRGVEAVRRTVRAALERNIGVLTIYSFSSENWSRPPREVAELMGLLKLFIRTDLDTLHRNKVRVKIIGQRTGLSSDIANLLAEAERRTASNSRLLLQVAFNYGARQEIVEAARLIARSVMEGRIGADAIDATTVSAHLDTAGVPDPDLVIRTSGEQRLSNFLLWQAAYAEFVFLPVLWPDFDLEAFDQALATFARRQRRYGGLAAVG